MATQPEFIDDQDDAEIEQDDQQDADDQADNDDDGEQEAATSDDEDDDEDVIAFGGVEARGEPESEGMRNLRARLKQVENENRSLKGGPKVEELGPEPNIDDYWENPEQYKVDLRAYDAKKAKVEEAQTAQQRQNEAIQKEYLEDVAEFDRQRSGLRVRDFDASFDKVSGTLNEAQVAILTQVARNKAPLMYALGKNPDKLDSLAKITNLAKFAGEVGRLDMETTVTKRKPTTTPETVHRGAGGGARGDAKLAALEKQADQTGDRSALLSYRRKLREAGKAA
jgi:hypothetical protein